MKRIKVIPFIISILFPLLCTSFIVCYSYGVNDTYTKNKDRYEVYVQNDYYDQDGAAKDEIKKAVTLDSDKYQLQNPKVINNAFGNDLTTELYGYTSTVTTTDDKGKDKTSLEIAYSLYVHGINYQNKYVNSTTFEQQEGVYLKDGGSLAVVYVKGIGGAPEEKLDKAIDELRTKGSTTTGTFVSGATIDVVDSDAKNFTSDKEGEKAPAYRISIFNSLNSKFYDFEDLDEMYKDDIADNQEVEKGYTLALINLYSKGATNAVKVISTVKLDDKTILDAKSFEAKEDVQVGYSGDYSKAGYSYIKFVWPTLLWQGALTLVITGILSVLFYAIWQTDEEETEEQKRIKKLQASKKANKKAKKAAK